MIRYHSERDFVANYIFLRLKEASRIIGLSDIIDFHVETPINGIADLTADRLGKRLFVLEAKFKKTGKVEHDIEPRDPDVINQAVNYFGPYSFISS